MDILLAFSSIKKNFKLTSLTCVMMDESYKPFPLFHAGDEELTKEEDYGLGQVWPDHIALVIADVSGKGVPASLFMVIAKTLIKMQSQSGKSPAQIFSEANNMLCEGNDQVLFVTCWLAVIELSTGKGIVANAGHVHPCFRRAGKAWELLEYDHDLPLAVMEDTPFQEHILSLEPGDSLYVYTDGVTEAMAGNGEQFGEERLLDALNEESESSPEKFLVHVKERIDGFIGEAPQFDDLTMLGITWKGRDSTL